MWASNTFPPHPLPPHRTRFLLSSASVSRPNAGTRTSRGMSLTLWTVSGSSRRLLLESDFSASRCLPAGYASLLRNTSVSHSSCGQAHRSVLSERTSETTRVGLAVANKQGIEGSAALCAALLELRLIRYEAILEPAFVSCERSHQSLHWESHQIFYSRPLWTQQLSPLPVPCCLSLLQLLLHGAEIGIFCSLILPSMCRLCGESCKWKGE